MEMEMRRARRVVGERNQDTLVLEASCYRRSLGRLFTYIPNTSMDSQLAEHHYGKDYFITSQRRKSDGFIARVPQSQLETHP